MKLKDPLQPIDFLKLIEQCTGDVLLCSKEGDQLNLKSQLSKYVFVSAILKPELLDNCWIQCEYSSDMELLSSYLQTEE